MSRHEQRRRFLSRIDEPEKHWKFSEADIKERAYWHDYMRAYEDVLRETSRAWAPWYAIPADNKPYMRYSVASIIVQTLESLDLHYPRIDEKVRQRFKRLREILVNDD